MRLAIILATVIATLTAKTLTGRLFKSDEDIGEAHGDGATIYVGGFASTTGGEHIPMTPEQLADILSRSEAQVGGNTLPDPLFFFRKEVRDLCTQADKDGIFSRERLNRINDVLDQLIPMEVEDVEWITAYVHGEEYDEGDERA